MKKTIICSIAACLLALVSCQKQIKVTDPITLQSPTPTEQITKVSLTETEKGYMKAGNAMAFRFLDKMYEGTNLIVSPLSLQYALAMTANGASGETLQEIVDFLGYGEDGIEALNAYSKKLIEELPAVDLNYGRNSCKRPIPPAAGFQTDRGVQLLRRCGEYAVHKSGLHCSQD